MLGHYGHYLEQAALLQRGMMRFRLCPIIGDWKQGKKGNVDGEARKKAPALMVSADKKGGYAEYETAITADKSASFILGADERGEGEWRSIQREER